MGRGRQARIAGVLTLGLVGATRLRGLTRRREQLDPVHEAFLDDRRALCTLRVPPDAAARARHVTLTSKVTRAVAAAAASSMAWGSIEARCLRRRVLEARLAACRRRSTAFTILHLSDVHAGHGPGLAMLRRAASWSEQLEPDLIVLTGDLVTRASGIDALQGASAALAATARVGAFAVLGNHDHGNATDPFADGGTVAALDGFELLPGARASLELRGQRVSLVGADANAYPRRRVLEANAVVDRSAGLRLLLCHYPTVLDRIDPGAFQLVLAGHMHAGQICVPWLTGRLGLAHRRARYTSGLYQREGTLMHVSPGLGTTFLPFRILARPEATLLVLRVA